MRTIGWGYLLWFACFLGLCGIHRFYAGKWMTGILWLVTLGFLGVGQLIDLLFIPAMVRSANSKTIRRGEVAYVMPAMA